MQVVIGIAVLLGIVVLFLVGYLGNQNTGKPEQYETLKADTKGCFNINQEDAGDRKSVV